MTTLPAAAVDGGDHPLRRRRRRPARARTSTSTSPSRNSAELAMTACAPASSTSCARSTLRMPPPTRQGSRRQIDATSARVVAAAPGGIEIDQLHARKAREALDPRLGIGRLDRQRSPARAGRRGRSGDRWRESASAGSNSGRLQAHRRCPCASQIPLQSSRHARDSA